MPPEPVDGQARDLLERTGLLEQVRGPGDDREVIWAAQLALGVAVELEHLPVATADDQQGRRGHLAESRRGEVGPPSA